MEEKCCGPVKESNLIETEAGLNEFLDDSLTMCNELRNFICGTPTSGSEGSSAKPPDTFKYRLERDRQKARAIANIMSEIKNAIGG